MEEGLLKEDGRKAMKKTLAAFSVFALAVAMVGASRFIVEYDAEEDEVVLFFNQFENV